MAAFLVEGTDRRGVTLSAWQQNGNTRMLPNRDRPPSRELGRLVVMTFDDRIRELEDQHGSPHEDHLLYERVIAYAPAGTNPGVNQTHKAVLENGSVGYHKTFVGVSTAHASLFQQHPDEVPINECAAWRLGYRLGPPFVDIIAPTVLREISGEPGSLSAQQLGVPHDLRPFTQAPNLVLAAAFFDSLIAQQDRHTGNYRWDKSHRKLGLIDHGYTLALPAHRANGSWFVDWRWRAGTQALLQQEVDALENLLRSGGLLGLRLFLLPERADALEDRAQRMLASGAILGVGEY
jgi:hypothetical protein